MTFPVVAATNTSTDAGTAATVSLPASIVSGDLLIIFFSSGGTTTHTTPSGWTQIFTANAGAYRLTCYYRVADGGEGSTVDVTISDNSSSMHSSYRITFYSGTPEGGSATGSSTTPDPPSLTASWGSADTLWLAGCVGVDFDTNPTVPSNYTDLLTAITSINVHASARRENATATEDPASFGGFFDSSWVAGTVAIRTVGTVTLSLTPATLNFTGQSIVANVAMPLVPAAVSFAGQNETFSVALTPTAGALQFQGQTVSLLDLSPPGKRGRLFLRPEGQRMASVWKGRLRVS